MHQRDGLQVETTQKNTDFDNFTIHMHVFLFFSFLPFFLQQSQPRLEEDEVEVLYVTCHTRCRTTSATTSTTTTTARTTASTTTTGTTTTTTTASTTATTTTTTATTTTKKTQPRFFAAPCASLDTEQAPQSSRGPRSCQRSRCNSPVKDNAMQDTKEWHGERRGCNESCLQTYHTFSACVAVCLRFSGPACAFCLAPPCPRCVCCALTKTLYVKTVYIMYKHV